MYKNKRAIHCNFEVYKFGMPNGITPLKQEEFVSTIVEIFDDFNAFNSNHNPITTDLGKIKPSVITRAFLFLKESGDLPLCTEHLPSGWRWSEWMDLTSPNKYEIYLMNHGEKEYGITLILKEKHESCLKDLQIPA